MDTGIFCLTLAKPFGAGDAFLGNFLVSLKSIDGDVHEAVQRGSAAA